MRFTRQVRTLDWLVARPIAHRGLHGGDVVENTPAAFAAAMAEGYTIECDLQLTADGEAVVFHDERLERLTAAKGWVKDMNAAGLRALGVQTLAELLEQVAGKAPLLIEIKSHWDGNVALVKRALGVLKSYEGAHCLMSFDPELIAAVKQLSPHSIRGIVADRAVDSYYTALPFSRRLELRALSHLPRTAPHFISYNFRDLPFAPVTAYRQDGNPVIGWTIRSHEDASAARRYSDQITFEGFRA